MGIVIVAILLLCIGVGFSCSVESKIDEKSKNNQNSVEDYLKSKGFKTSQIQAFNLIMYKNEIKQFRVDLEHKQVAICRIFLSQDVDIIDFSDIIECEIIEDSNTIMKGGVGRAVVGGVLAGGVGAVVGANTRASQNVTNSLQIRIVTKSISRSLYTIDILTTETKRDSVDYKNAMNFANNVYATITSIINSNEKNSNNLEEKKDIEQSNTDFIEQLEKLSKLKETGVITQEEFEESKKKMLSKL